MAPRRTGATPPTYVPRSGGLFSVAPPTDFDDVHERNGIDWRPEPFVEARSYGDDCADPAAVRAKTFDGQIDYREADPFSVYAGEVCSPVGVDVSERDRRMIASVQNGEERAVERVLWTGTTSNGETVAPAFVGGGGTAAVAGTVSLRGAFAALERMLAETYGGVGVIHAPVDAAALATYDLDVEMVNGRLQTKLGNRVVAGGGYPGTGPGAEVRPAGGSYLFATGAVSVRRGPIEPLGDFPSSFDRAHNTSVRVGERTYVVGFDGPLYYALADYDQEVGA